MKKIILFFLTIGAFLNVSADDVLIKGSLGIGEQNMQLVATRTPVAANMDTVIILPYGVAISFYGFTVLDHDQKEIDYRLAYAWRGHTVAIGTNDFGIVGDFDDRADVFAYNFAIEDTLGFGGAYGKPSKGNEGYFVFAELAYGLPKSTKFGVNFGQEMFTKESYQTIYLKHGSVIGDNIEILNKLAYQNDGTNNGWYTTFNLVYHIK